MLGLKALGSGALRCIQCPVRAHAHTGGLMNLMDLHPIPKRLSETLSEDYADRNEWICQNTHKANTSRFRYKHIRYSYNTACTGSVYILSQCVITRNRTSHFLGVVIQYPSTATASIHFTHNTRDLTHMSMEHPPG